MQHTAVNSSPSYILALDVGTLSVRAALYDQFGKEKRFISKPIYLNQISETHIEQNPAEILEKLQEAIDEVFASTIRKEQVAVAGLSTQRSSVVAWDKETGEPLTNVLSWQDRRAYDQLNGLTHKRHLIKEKSGLFVTPHYGATKLRWLLDHQPIVGEKRKEDRLVFGPLAAFVVSNLAQNRTSLVDHVNASRTQLMDLVERCWSDELLSYFDVPGDLLPTIQPTQSFFGMLKASNIPLGAVNGDQNAAIHGLGSLEEGTFIVNIGTGAFVLLPTGNRPIHHPRLLASIANSDEHGATYLLEGTVNGAGAALQWAAERWQQPELTKQLGAWLDEITDPPIFVNTIGGLGSPMWREGSSPYFSKEGTIAEKGVAIVESIIFLIKLNLDTMTNTGQEVKRIRISGGLSAIDGVCQLLADISQRLVVRSQSTQSTSRGIAWLAAKPSQDWNNLEDDYFLPRQNRPLQSRYRMFCSLIGWN